MPAYLPDRTFAADEIIQNLAAEHGTPFYLYDEAGLRQSARRISHLMPWASDPINYFPLFENLNPSLLEIIREEGAGLQVSNRAELLYAQKLGFTEKFLLYEPASPDKAAEAAALQAGARWLVNSPALLPEGPAGAVILRYLPADLPFHAPQMRRIENSRNGMRKEALQQCLPLLRQRGVSHLGLALQISAYSVQPGYWANKAAVLFQLCTEIQDSLQTEIEYCYIGEGPGLPYRPMAKAPGLEEEAEKIHVLYEKLSHKPAICTGISKQLMDPSGLLVTRVQEVRHNIRRYLVVDAGTCQYFRSVLKKAYRHVSLLGNSEMEHRICYTLLGETSEEYDRICDNRMLPETKPGDLCVLHDVGCGGRSMPFIHGGICLPAEFLLQEDGTVRQISPRRSPEELFQFLTAW